MDELDPIVAELKARRLKLGLTQAEVGRRLDITKGALGRLERGHGGSPLIVTVRRWCRALDLDVFTAPKLDERGRRRGPAPTSPHGTVAAARRHYARSEALCWPCRVAQRDYDRERKRVLRKAAV